MAKRLYVGNLPFSSTEDDLTKLFSKYGKVISTVLIIDKYTGQSKGFAFVEMEKEDEAAEAIKKLNNSKVDDREIIVNEARPREERSGYNDRNSNRNYRSSRGGRRY